MMRLMTSGWATVTSALLVLATTGSAQADFQTTVGPSAYARLQGGSSTPVTLPSFTSLAIPNATLDGVEIVVSYNLAAGFSVTNSDSQSHTFANASASYGLSVGDNTNSPLTTSMTATLAGGTASPGTSSFLTTPASGTNTSSEITTNLFLYTGVSTVNLFVTLGNGSFSATETNGTGDLSYNGNGNGNGSISLIYFYGISSPLTVPEPSSLVLMGLGVGFVGLFGRRKFRHRAV